jgi:hypothetical protein
MDLDDPAADASSLRIPGNVIADFEACAHLISLNSRFETLGPLVFRQKSQAADILLDRFEKATEERSLPNELVKRRSLRSIALVGNECGPRTVESFGFRFLGFQIEDNMHNFCKSLTVGAATLALTVGGLTLAFAETSTSPSDSSTSGSSTGPGAGNSGASDEGAKTSDRTPGDATPQRTPNATATGAAGTDVGKTSGGTSDRTPSTHYIPPSN